MLETFVRFDSDTDKFTGRFNETFLREQTVLRFCVARSEHARDTAARRRSGHEKNGTVRAFCFGQCGVDRGIPSNAGVTDGLRAGTNVGWSCSLPERGHDGYQADERYHEMQFHGFLSIQYFCFLPLDNPRRIALV